MTRRNCRIGAMSAALLAGVLCADEGFAQQRVSTRIPAGGERSVAAFGSVSRSTCQGETPAVRIIQAPVHGRLRTGTKKETINTAGHPCFGRTVERRTILYTPKDDAVTSDSFTVHRSGTPSSRRDETYIFQVSVFKPAPGVSTAPAPGGAPLAPRPLELQASPARPSSGEFPRRYQEPPVPMLRSVRTK
jgi:hypothetical protein